MSIILLIQEYLSMIDVELKSNGFIYVPSVEDETEWVFDQGGPSQFAEVRSQNTIFIEELSEKQDGLKFECRTKKQEERTEFNLLVICECNLEDLISLTSYRCFSNSREKTEGTVFTVTCFNDYSFIFRLMYSYSYHKISFCH